MAIPLRLETYGVELPESVHHIIQRRLELISKLYPRIVSCHLIVHAPDGHHRKGEPYRVTLSFMMPGNELIDAAPPIGQPDPRQANVRFAVDDAFRRAERRLNGTAEMREPRQRLHRSTRKSRNSVKS